MDEPRLDGPRAPDSVVPPPEHRVSGLTRGQPAWAELRSDGAELMAATGDAVDQAGQGVLFDLYSCDLAALRGQLVAAGIDAGEIEDGTPGPREEMELRDPDGYVLKIAQIEPEGSG